MARRASAVASVSRIPGGLLSGDAAEHRADGHAKSGEIAASENVAGHDLAAGEQVGGGPAVLHQHPRLLVHLQAEIGKRNAGTQRVAVEWRLVDRTRPVRFRRRQAFGAAIIQPRRIELPRLHGGVVLRNGRLQHHRIEAIRLASSPIVSARMAGNTDGMNSEYAFASQTEY